MLQWCKLHSRIKLRLTNYKSQIHKFTQDKIFTLPLIRIDEADDDDDETKREKRKNENILMVDRSIILIISVLKDILIDRLHFCVDFHSFLTSQLSNAIRFGNRDNCERDRVNKHNHPNRYRIGTECMCRYCIHYTVTVTVVLNHN